MGAVQSAGQVVAWVCDPMHGNTECVAGYKTRRYDNIRAEVCTTPAALHGQKICSFFGCFRTALHHWTGLGAASEHREGWGG